MKQKKVKTLAEFVYRAEKNGGVESYLDRLQDANYQLGKIQGTALSAGKVVLLAGVGVAAFETVKWLVKKEK